MRVVQVIESFAYGSAKSVKQLSNIVKSEASVVVFYGERDGTELELAALDADVEWVPLPGKGPLKHFENILFLRNEFNKGGYIWHAHSTFAGFYIRILSLFNIGGSPLMRLLYSPRGYAFLREDKSKLSKFFFRLVEKLLAKKALTVACGSAEYEIAKSLGGEVVLINNSLEIPSKVHQYHSEGVVLSIGRISYQKGFDIFLDIIKQLPDKSFVWIGSCEPEDKGYLKDLPENLTIIPYLRHEEVIHYIEQSSMVLLPSRWEGLSRVLLETLVVGRPIVTSECAANIDCLLPTSAGYKNGFSCVSISDYVNAINALGDDIAMANSMAEESRKYAESNFNYKDIQAAWLKLYSVKGENL